MKILSMQASFGRLQNERLELHDGLNVVTAPNESGKSTWAAFLLAMLYGVDTSQRASAGMLPAKTKYKPWSGAPMEGRMELLWQGKKITIERTGKGRTPMGEFRAYETDSAQPVAGMTGENCGEWLLGVGRSVFERSAFVGQNAAGVTSDAALEKRLSSLVTAGDETVSASDTAARLRDWRNRCRHNRTGLLPQAEQQRAQVEDRLAQIHELHKNDLTLRAQEAALSARQAELEKITQALRAQEAARAMQQRGVAAQALQDAQADAEAARGRTVHIPPREVLTELSQQLAFLQTQAAQPLPQPGDAPSAPACPAAFSGLSEAEIPERAQADAHEVERLSAGRPRPVALPLAMGALATAGLLACALILKDTIPGVLAALCALTLAVWLPLTLRHNRAAAENAAKAQTIAAHYEDRPRETWAAFAAEYCGKLALYVQQKRQYDALCAERQAREQVLLQTCARLLGQVSMFAPDAKTAEQGAQAVQDALNLHDEADAARRAADVAQSRYDAVCAALGEQKAPAAPMDVDTADWTLAAAQQALLQVQSQRAALRSRLDQSQGRAAALGDPAVLEAEREQLTARITQLTARYAALERAEAALSQADGALQTRFSPQIGKLAGELLGAMTDGRYDTVLLDRKLRAEARQTGESITRELLYLSGGTADQVYLAVRLAICRLALGADTPLILDDALVRFDDRRMKSALALLREEAKTRQIILFTCQTREQAALNNMEA